MAGVPTSPLWPYLGDIAAQRAKSIPFSAIAEAISAALGRPISGKHVQEFYKYNKGRTGEPVTADPIPRREPRPGPTDVRDMLDIPPRPFAVPIAKAKAPAVIRGLQRSLVFGDTHVPHQDDAAVATIEAVIADMGPDTILHTGDLLDCYTISAFAKDPNRKFSLQDEIDAARALLHRWAQLAPRSRRVLLEGNHEDRLRRVIWNLPGGAAELARLTAFKRAITWPALLGLADVGWEFVPTEEQTRTSVLPKIITKHGTVVRKWSGFTAKGEWERYGKGGLSGHTHRLGKFYHRDHNGSHVWVEAGCTCRLDPDYMTDPDWQQGFLVITHTADGERYTVEDVYIENGVAVWRGKVYAAA